MLSNFTSLAGGTRARFWNLFSSSGSDSTLGRFLQHCIAWIQRQISFNQIALNGASLAGLGAIAVSLKYTWFEVPLAPPHGASDTSDIVMVSPACTAWFQASMLVGVLCILGSWLYRFTWNGCSTFFAALLCIVPLTFPYFVMMRSPIISAEAAWLQLQHDNLIWLGGDIYNNAEFASRGWKAKSYLIDLPQNLSVVELPSWSAWELGLDRGEDLILWLGYSNAFCNFASRGWFMAVLGSAILFVCTLQTRGRFMFARAGAALALFSFVALTVVIIGWSLPFRASVHVERAAALCSRNQPNESLSELNQAVALLPTLSQDTFYVAQRGVLEAEIGLTTEYTELRQAIQLEASGKYDQAFNQLESLIDSNEPAVRREALRAIMRFAIQDYNCARFQLSAERFHTVLRLQPCNLKLLYLLQLQAIREGRSEIVLDFRDRLYDATNRMRFGTKKIVRAAANQHAVIAVGMPNRNSDVRLPAEHIGMSPVERIVYEQTRAKRP